MTKKRMISLFVIMILLSLSGCDGDNAVRRKTADVTNNQNTVAGDDKNSRNADTSYKEEASADNTKTMDDKELTGDTPSAHAMTASGEAEIDLTQLSSTMVYSEVYNMMVAPEDYVGKTVRMRGAFSVYEDAITGKRYFTCIISDATACCSQGLEFIWKGEHKYPEDYPQSGSEITVTGEFQTYEEDGSLYCNLLEAELDRTEN